RRMKKVPGGLTPTFGTLLLIAAMEGESRQGRIAHAPKSGHTPGEQQKTARRRFRSQIYGWASRIPALCERSPPWRKRLRANP
ncbi:MAG: hypothetical protein Q4Q30_03305, partial [Eggerthella sp.]|nr:hypothetical protein [Eggerthella sp.]